MSSTKSKGKIKTVHFIIGLATIVITILLVVVLAINANNVNLQDSMRKANSNKLVTSEDLVASPYAYEGASIKFKGKIFVAEGTIGAQALQVYSDAEDSDGNILVYNFSNTTYEEGEYIAVTGKVDKASEGENAFGAKLTVPAVIADSITKVSADEAIAPAIRTTTLNETKNIDNLFVTLKKVDYATNETRLYVVFDNKSKTDYSFYSFNSVLIQARKSFKEKYVYGRDDNSSSSSTITAGTINSVTLYYDPLQYNETSTFTLHVTDQSNYSDSELKFKF